MLLIYFLFSYSKQDNEDNLLCFVISFWHINARSPSKIIYFLPGFIFEFWTKLLFKFDFTVVENQEGFFLLIIFLIDVLLESPLKKALVNIEDRILSIEISYSNFSSCWVLILSNLGAVSKFLAWCWIIRVYPLFFVQFSSLYSILSPSPIPSWSGPAPTNMKPWWLML